MRPRVRGPSVMTRGVTIEVDRLAGAPHAPVHRDAGAIAHRGADALEHRLRVDDGLAVDALDAVARAQSGRRRRPTGAHLAHHRLAKRAGQPDLTQRIGIDLAHRHAVQIERHRVVGRGPAHR